MPAFSDALNLIKETGMFEVVVPFLFVYIIVYALLTKTEKLSTSKELNSVLAFIIALSVALVPQGRAFLMNLVPFFTLFALVFFMIVLVALIAGIPVAKIEKEMGAGHTRWGIAGLSVVILLLAIGVTFQSTFEPSAVYTNESWQNMTLAERVEQLPPGERVMFILSQPQVVGLGVLLMLFAFAGHFFTKL